MPARARLAGLVLPISTLRGMQRARADTWHPDLVAGSLSRLLQLVTRPVTNTLSDLDVYRGRALDELFPAPRDVPAATVRARWRLPGLVSEDLEFPSLHVPLEGKFQHRYAREYRETHTVHARRLRPTGAPTRRRLLYLHGYMQPETWIEEIALLARMSLLLDAEIIQMQFPYHGRRTPSGSRFSGEYFWTADLVRSVEALRQSLLDARTLLGILLERDERPVGVTGLSLGGALTLGLTCLDDRFAFSIPLIAHMDLAALVSDAPVLSGMRRDLRAFGWNRARFREFVDALGWNDLRPKLPPEQILLFAASNDRFFDPAIVRRMRALWGNPPIRWYPCSHMGFLQHLPRVLKEMRSFIDGRGGPNQKRNNPTLM